MRKLILIAAVSLLPGQAYAGGSRSLSLAATNESQTTAQATAAPQATQAPGFRWTRKLEVVPPQRSRHPS